MRKIKKAARVFLAGIFITSLFMFVFAINAGHINGFVNNVLEKANLNQFSIENPQSALAAAWNNGKAGEWPVQMDGSQITLDTSDVREYWRIYMSEGASGDNKSDADTLICDQGDSINSNRNGEFSTYVTLAPNLRTAANRGQITWEFRAFIKGDEVARTSIQYIFEYYTAANPTSNPVRSASGNVWGTGTIYDGQGAGSSGTQTTRYFRDAAPAGLAYTRIKIRIYFSKTSNLVQFNDLDCTADDMLLSVYGKYDSAAPTISPTSYTASNVATISDTGSAIWKYAVDGGAATILADGGAGVTSRAYTMPTQKAYSIQVWDNFGNTATYTVNYYNPTVRATTYLNGVYNGTTTPGSIKIDSGTAAGQPTANGKTVGSSYMFTAIPADGYYLQYWQKFNGANPGTSNTNTTISYPLVANDAYTTTLDWYAQFYSISTDSKAVDFNGSAQSVDSPAGIPSGFTTEILYEGSATAPINAGTYSVAVNIKNGAILMGTKTVTLTIRKVIPNFSATAAPISYGQLASASTRAYSLSHPTVSGLTYPNNINGTFTWNASTNILPVGAYSYTVTFTPDTTTALNYNGNTADVILTVNKAIPTLTNVSTSEIFYGQALPSITGTVTNPNGGASVAGNFAWPSSGFSTPATVAQGGVKTVTFMPADTGNYATNTVQLELTIKKTTPVLSNLSASEIDYEYPLTASAVSGNKANPHDPNLTVNGTFNWNYTAITSAMIADQSLPTVNESGNLPVIFTVFDTANYENALSNDTYIYEAYLTVRKKDQTINLLTQPTGPGDLLKTESIALDMADYEVAWSPYADGSALCKITLSATTTALNPTPRRISFAIDTSTIATLGPVTEATTVDGFSKTTRELYFGYTSGSGGMLTEWSR
jgi:hypothetical protein